MRAKDSVEWFSHHATEFDSLYQKSKDFQERFDAWSKVIDKYSTPNQYALDVGCGSGIFSFYLAQRSDSVLAIDGSAEMLKICKEKQEKSGLKNIDFKQYDIYELSRVLSKKRKADIIVCSSVLEYVDDLGKAINILSSLLKRRGVLIFSMPNRSSIYRKIEPIIYRYYRLTRRHHYYRYVKNVCTLDQMKEKVKNYNLTIIESDYYAATWLLSMVCRKIGLRTYSDNLFLAVAQRSNK